MDLFTHEPGPQYGPAFAGRLLVSMGYGIARAADPIKRAFADEDAEGLWALAMMVVQWYADKLPGPEAQAVAATLQEPGLSAFASYLNVFRERLLPFVRTAHQAHSEAQLAAAGVYFAAAVEQIGVSVLQSAMKAGPVRMLQQKLLGRLPLPDELRAAYYQALGTQSKEPAVRPAASPSRAERFDRADFSPRRAVAPPSVPLLPREQTRAQRSAGGAVSPTPAPRPPTPILAQADVTRAYLFTLGWEGADVERFLEGPDGKNRG